MSTYLVYGSYPPATPFDTIVQFRAKDAEGNEYVVCADHRPAEAILDALEDQGEVEVEAEDYMVRRA